MVANLKKRTYKKTGNKYRAHYPNNSSTRTKRGIVNKLTIPKTFREICLFLVFWLGVVPVVLPVILPLLLFSFIVYSMKRAMLPKSTRSQRVNQRTPFIYVSSFSAYLFSHRRTIFEFLLKILVFSTIVCSPLLIQWLSTDTTVLSFIFDSLSIMFFSQYAQIFWAFSISAFLGIKLASRNLRVRHGYESPSIYPEEHTKNLPNINEEQPVFFNDYWKTALLDDCKCGYYSYKFVYNTKISKMICPVCGTFQDEFSKREEI